MAVDNTQFLKFSAYSMKDYLTRKITEQTKYTDQIYEGSNLAILIDLCAYLYQCLIYQLNSAAAEAMFSDTQIYENINRLVKMLGYSPRGIIPSYGTFYLNNLIEYSDNKTNEGGLYFGKLIPKYSFIDLKIQDNNGKNICFSTVEDYTINSEENYSFQMVNGKWRLYDTIFEASGSDFESFILDGIQSDVESEKNVANGYVHVYIKDSETKTIEQWTGSQYELFLENNINDDSYGRIIDGDKKVFNLRLNENKTYEIKFGDGVIGKKLKQGDLIYIFYLDSNGLYGQVNPDQLESGLKLSHSSGSFGLAQEDYNLIFNNRDNLILDVDNPPDIFLLDVTSIPKAEQTVSEIKIAAPEEFKLGRRLVTKSDYEYYVKNAFLGQVIDVKCQNNYEYIAQSFYIWLYNLGVNKHNNMSYYINEIDLVKYGFKYSDPADSNNVYLWIKLYKQSIDNFQPILLNKLQNLKTLTHEIVPLEPVNVNFAICAAPQDDAVNYLTQDVFDKNIENWIEITINSNYLYSQNNIQSQIANLIRSFFDPINQKLGQLVDIGVLIKNIMLINGVQNIRTVYQKISTDPNVYTQPIIKQGICFASWSSTYIDAGDDLEITNTARKLQDFQFPSLKENNIEQHIKVIKQSITNLNVNVQY